MLNPLAVLFEAVYCRIIHAFGLGIPEYRENSTFETVRMVRV